MNATPAPLDAELVALAREGDEAAFVELCSRYEARVQARIERRLSGKLRRKVSVADVMQEAKATAHGRLPYFNDRGDGAFGAWLGGIAAHKLQELHRRYGAAAKRDVQREVSRGGVPDPEHARHRDPTPSTIAMAAEQRDALAEAMGRLSPDHRRVLELLQIKGHSAAETAALMERSTAAVRKLYARALARLADLLEDPERQDGDA